MPLLPTPKASTVDLIDAAYEAEREGPRLHLGASVIGRPCDRELWLGFRWFPSEPFSGRMLRLFEDGKDAEAQFVRNLRRIKCTVHEFDPDTGEQIRVQLFGGHFGGSADGVAINIPEAPGTWHLLEFKTHNDRSFKKLCAVGVEKAKPEHYAQMTVYMGLLELDRGLYLAKNKNDSCLYAERVYYDHELFLRLQAKAERIIFSSRPPARLPDRGCEACQWCNFQSFCWDGEGEPEKNCRTCAFSTPTRDGDWRCEENRVVLSGKDQKAGCKKHRLIVVE